MTRRIASVVLAVTFGLLATAAPATAAPTPTTLLGDLHCC